MGNNPRRGGLPTSRGGGEPARPSHPCLSSPPPLTMLLPLCRPALCPLPLTMPLPPCRPALSPRPPWLSPQSLHKGEEQEMIGMPSEYQRRRGVQLGTAEATRRPIHQAPRRMQPGTRGFRWRGAGLASPPLAPGPPSLSRDGLHWRANRVSKKTMTLCLRLSLMASTTPPTTSSKYTCSAEIGGGGSGGGNHMHYFCWGFVGVYLCVREHNWTIDRVSPRCALTVQTGCTGRRWRRPGWCRPGTCPRPGERREGSRRETSEA